MAALLAALLAGCPAPRDPGSVGAPAAANGALEIRDSRASSAHRTLGCATGDGATLWAALDDGAASEIGAAKLGGAWAPLRPATGGHCTHLAKSGPLLGAVFAGAGSIADQPVRGEPAAALLALSLDGAERWRSPVDSTEWSIVSTLAAAPDHGFVVGGSFSGTLRIADKVVSSAGKSDGFAARFSANGAVIWLIRVGGPGADAVQGVATSGDRVAIAGTFAAGADLLGQVLVPVDERLPFADGFVAELDAATGARRWAQSFGGKADDSVAGVAIDAHGRVAVAATARDTVHVNGAELVARGTADGLVAWWSPGGAGGAAVLLGGADFDGLRAITAVGDRIVVGGFFSGSIQLGARTLAAAGGDDSFAAALDPSGRVLEAWPLSGDGREELASLTAIPGGFVAAVSHTGTLAAGGDTLPAPADPMSGAALIVRGVR